jgi:hypothetical protein
MYSTSINAIISAARSLLLMLTVYVYACGFLIFAVAPYLLLQKSIPAQRPWIEISLVTVRLGLTALLILLGWALTLRALSILTVAEKS